jgi:hypothetical protein
VHGGAAVTVLVRVPPRRPLQQRIKDSLGTPSDAQAVSARETGVAGGGSSTAESPGHSRATARGAPATAAVPGPVCETTRRVRVLVGRYTSTAATRSYYGCRFCLATVLQRELKHEVLIGWPVREHSKNGVLVTCSLHAKGL